MKIAIIGAGISGLSQYLWLQKVGVLEHHSVTIYEARPGAPDPDQKPDINTDDANPETYNASLIGAGIGLSPTGLKVLKRLSPALHTSVLETGHIVSTWRMSNARGWTLSRIPAGGEDEMMVMIGREECNRLLREQVPDTTIVRRKVVNLNLNDDEESRPELVFQDGSMETVDLVIACDGIWSRCRRAIFHSTGREAYPYAPRYEGLVGVGGFIPTSKLSPSIPAGEMNVVLGANGFFGYGHSTGSSEAGPTATWWSTYSLSQCPEDWRTIDKTAVKTELQKRHLGWKNKIIQMIVQDVEIDSLYPTFITPLLSTWQRAGCVLVGDAAHALQPSSGQGASMALEDCETLALLVQYHLSADNSKGHWEAAKQYSDLRRPRLDMVFKEAQELAGMKQDMGFVQEMLMYFFVWLFGRLRVHDSYQRKLNDYDVPKEVMKATDQIR